MLAAAWHAARAGAGREGGATPEVSAAPAPKDAKGKALAVNDRVKIMSFRDGPAAEAVVKVVGVGSPLMSGKEYKVGTAIDNFDCHMP